MTVSGRAPAFRPDGAVHGTSVPGSRLPGGGRPCRDRSVDRRDPGSARRRPSRDPIIHRTPLDDPDDIAAIVAALGDLVGIVRNADLADKAEPESNQLHILGLGS